MAGIPPSKSDRREQAREKAAALRAEQLKREARGRRITLLSIIVGLVIVAGLIAFVVISGNKKVNVNPDASAPTTAVGINGGISFGADGVAGTSNDGAIVVETYLDFLCPWCAKFEAENTANLDEFREAGEITLVVHPISMLSGGDKTAYSSRAASAFAYVADNAPDKALAFSTALYTNQPPETGDGLSDDEIVDLAKGAGVPEDVAKAAVGNQFADWAILQYQEAAARTELLDAQSRFTTPTIVIDGEKFTGNATSADEFRAALETAIAGGGSTPADDANADQ
ncbi:thioredoxin domain-containing protein [Rarobacter faecitabidus]|uniref:Protein-disulfide isomerase n=1 Tax=Rarobacter faecitabidus TaxID=13243 RepID=A0A542ZTN3_RARFA|nr:thioredoxin domain-containing protein [Rarobacter faecitabidus]TQL63711.1 protein-disulfide isomerase [Rarobacter faecitabidus]